MKPDKDYIIGEIKQDEFQRNFGIRLTNRLTESSIRDIFKDIGEEIVMSYKRYKKEEE